MQQAPITAPSTLKVEANTQRGIQLRCRICDRVHVPGQCFIHFIDARRWVQGVKDAHRECARP